MALHIHIYTKDSEKYERLAKDEIKYHKVYHDLEQFKRDATRTRLTLTKSGDLRYSKWIARKNGEIYGEYDGDDNEGWIIEAAFKENGIT